MKKKFLAFLTIAALGVLVMTMALPVSLGAPRAGKQNSCSDTDGGNIITVFGTVSGYYNRQPYSYSDYCVDSGNIKEYYCSGVYQQSQQQSCGTDGYVGNNYCMSGDVYKNYTDYYCSGGACSSNTSAVLQQDCVSGQYCSNGACYWSDSCSDTDGGLVTTIQGTVSGYLSQQQYSNTDFCVTNTTVKEFYCSGNYAYNSTLSCITNSTTQCLNGACV